MTTSRPCRITIYTASMLAAALLPAACSAEPEAQPPAAESAQAVHPALQAVTAFLRAREARDCESMTALMVADSIYRCGPAELQSDVHLSGTYATTGQVRTAAEDPDVLPGQAYVTMTRDSGSGPRSFQWLVIRKADGRWLLDI